MGTPQINKIKSCDVGSLPFSGNLEKYLEGATFYPSSPEHDSAKYFERKVLQAFLDKIGTGIQVPNFPQFRDMSEMFLSMMDGLEKVKGGYIETGAISLKAGEGDIMEVLAIKRNMEEISGIVGHTLALRICVTGPYTLSTFFPYKTDEIFPKLSNALSKIVEKNVFKEKHAEVVLFSLDEPIFGLVDDPMVDIGAKGRENLRKAWENIFHQAKAKNAQTCLHLHSTSNELFWETKHLDIIESHVEDPIYKLETVRKRLETEDKFLKASICTSDFDQLIKEKITAQTKNKLSQATLNEKISEAWKTIQRGNVDPKIFLEDIEAMKKRLSTIVERFTPERIPYVGPECGLRGFPTYDSALECLRRVAKTVKDTGRNKVEI
jgi:5-methyltetrahydropteroyltriglutamate--homocysteine methyltransferase